MQGHFKKYLKTHQTPQEIKLWYHLRAKRFYGFKFRRQVEISSYIVDFLCYEKRLIIEIDGGQHDYPEQHAYDTRRTAYLESEGFQIIRFWNNDVHENLFAVLKKIETRLFDPSPQPSPARGEGKMNPIHSINPRR